MHSTGFEPAIPAFKRPQTHALHRTSIRIGAIDFSIVYFMPVPVAARSHAWVGSRSLAGIAGLNPAGVMDVCLM